MRDEQCPFNGIYSADEVEGMALDTLNKLVHFIDVLQDFKAKLTPDDTLTNKAQILSELLNTIYESESDDSWDLLVLQKVLEDIGKHHDNGDYSEAVSQRIVHATDCSTRRHLHQCRWPLRHRRRAFQPPRRR